MVLGFRPVTHRGIVSAITPIAIPQLTTGTLDPKMIKRLRDPYLVYQLDATAYPGNSGSPLYGVEDGSLMIENRFPAQTIAGLKARGHDVQVMEAYATIMGSSQVIVIDRENGVLQAGADPRRQAYAIGR